MTFTTTHESTPSPGLSIGSARATLGRRSVDIRIGSAESTLAQQQLEALLRDDEFAKLIDVAIAEVMRVWNVPRKTAAGFVMSAVGEPGALARIHREWFSAKERGTGFGLARVIVRRRVFDLLRCDARRPHHESLPPRVDDVDGTLSSLDDRVHRDPHAQAELKEVVHLVRQALRRFEAQGPVEARQARLVQRYALDETTYSDLAAKLACSESALRVRVHKAMRALRKYIESCHPELEELLGRASDACSSRSGTSGAVPRLVTVPQTVARRQDHLVSIDPGTSHTAG
jgi:RNA polymerase sigma factor (sigma-70 family)